MVDTPAFRPIEEKHGPDCTCPSAGRIEIELVAADRACPGDRNPHRAARTAAQADEFEPPQIAGVIDITWPPSGKGCLAAWHMRIHDAETGEDLGIDTSSVAVRVDADGGLAVAELTMLVDADGKQIHGNTKAMVVDEGGSVRTAVFRYYIREIRQAAPAGGHADGPLPGRP